MIVAEGVFDYLTLTAWGYPAVAALGTQGMDKVAAALRGCPRVFLAFDNDDAGDTAARPQATAGQPRRRGQPAPRRRRPGRAGNATQRPTSSSAACWQGRPTQPASQLPTNLPLYWPAFTGGPFLFQPTQPHDGAIGPADGFPYGESRCNQRHTQHHNAKEQRSWVTATRTTEPQRQRPPPQRERQPQRQRPERTPQRQRRRRHRRPRPPVGRAAPRRGQRPGAAPGPGPGLPARRARQPQLRLHRGPHRHRPGQQDFRLRRLGLRTGGRREPAPDREGGRQDRRGQGQLRLQRPGAGQRGGRAAPHRHRLPRRNRGHPRGA